jgi:hypothetical protein
VIVSIFFPPAWFALLAYIAYLLITKQTRRDRVILQEIRNSIATGNGEAVTVKHLYYEAAKSFAAEHGASMSPYKNDPEDDCLVFDLAIDGNKYGICVQRWLDGGTLLTVNPR